jgi:23S rRNA (adenine2503-C2)-methyltransferase
MTDRRLDISGRTFEDVVRTLQPPRGQLRELRAQYRRLMRGESSCEPDLRLALLPVARRRDSAGVTKFAYGTADGFEVESVIVPMQHSGRHWKSVCVSSQLGCARGCRFCETAALGLLRNLSAGEIVAQVLHAQREFGGQTRNVVFMGMGEPLDNFDAVVQAVRVLTDRSGPSLKMARLTISTIGSAPGLRRLSALGWRRLNLAISLNAANDELRCRLMPAVRSESLSELREALVAYPLRRNQHFMIQYVLIPAVNDTHEHARELASYLEPIRCLVNVIPHNPRLDSPWPVPDEPSVRQFLDWLKDAGQPCRRRVTRGREEMAACGQLGNRALLARDTRAFGA